MHFALLIGLAGCAKASAASAPNGPPLQVPAPPPRVIVPVEELAAAPAPQAPIEPASAPRPGATARPVPRPETRTETPPVAAAPAPAAAPATPPPAEGREVRSVPAAAAAGEERKVRDVMARAMRDLNRVDYQKLSTPGKAQYDQSKRFSDEAEQALKEKNFVYAMTLADKAATLAAQLAGR